MSDNDNKKILQDMCKQNTLKSFSIIDKSEFTKITDSKTFTLPYIITDILLSDINACDNYKSDILIGIQTLYDEIKDLIKHPDLKVKRLMFGYRKNGIDGNISFISNFKTWQACHNYDMAANYYRRNYIAEIGIIDENFKYAETYNNIVTYYTGDIYIALHDVTNNITLN